jgi:hypothetical protein
MTDEIVSGKVVHYIGTADVREITQDQWDSISIKQDTTVWSAENGFRIDVAVISDDAMAYIESDPLLVITDAPV